tara:strand:- start:14954 stop:15181 length:228 start_codon:yes stop_codon:yes gene_type:complete
MSKPIKDILVKALTELKYADADAEADLIMSYVDGFITTVLLKSDSINISRLLKTNEIINYEKTDLLLRSSNSSEP